MNDFYKDWMEERRNYWFNQNDANDLYLSSNYGYLIDSYNYNFNYNNKNKIIGILIYDQLTRHYYRKEKANHIITYFNRKALEIANLNKNDEFISSLSKDDWHFYMLVYRHTNERNHLLFVMKEAWKKERFSKQFIKATYSRANFKEELETYDYNDYDNNNYDFNDYDKTILEFNPEPAVIADNYNYLIGDFSHLTNLIHKNQLIIVSFSGGVDSICCLFLLSKMTTNLIAVHINYNNRKETAEEVKFLRNICKNLKIKLFVRTINEIKRQPCIDNDLRDIYESYTKNIRYNSYKKANDSNNPPIVVLGHNKDDCLENILTNISYKNKYDNLNGIEIASLIDNIYFHRPLINTSKEEIYKFAKNHNLPYLKNSTPEWSQRGKIRTSVVPILEKWDIRIIDGLFSLSSILKDLHLNLQLSINDFQISKKDEINNLNLSFLYWKYGICKLFHFYPSNKSLRTLIERLELWKSKFKKHDYNKKTKIIINKNLILFLWKIKNGTNDYYHYNLQKMQEL